MKEIARKDWDLLLGRDRWRTWVTEFAREVEPPARARLLGLLKGARFEPGPVTIYGLPDDWTVGEHSGNNRPPWKHYPKFKVFWGSPDKELISAFSAWLKKNRPQGSDPWERRGGTREDPHVVDLNALSILRLFRALGSMKAAMEHAKGKRTFYSSEAKWYSAKKRAERIISDLNKGWCPVFGWPREHE